MHDLGWKQESSKLTLHHEPMLAHIAMSICVRVIWLLHKNIAILVNNSPSTPCRVVPQCLPKRLMGDRMALQERPNVATVGPSLARHLRE